MAAGFYPIYSKQSGDVDIVYLHSCTFYKFKNASFIKILPFALISHTQKWNYLPSTTSISTTHLFKHLTCKRKKKYLFLKNRVVPIFIVHYNNKIGRYPWEKYVQMTGSKFKRWKTNTTALQSAVHIGGELLETHIPWKFAHELSFARIGWERHHGHGWGGFDSAGQWWRWWSWWHGGGWVVIERCVIRLEKHPNAAIFSYAVGHVEWIHPNCEFFRNDGKYDGLV